MALQSECEVCGGSFATETLLLIDKPESQQLMCEACINEYIGHLRTTIQNMEEKMKVVKRIAKIQIERLDKFGD